MSKNIRCFGVLTLLCLLSSCVKLYYVSLTVNNNSNYSGRFKYDEAYANLDNMNPDTVRSISFTFYDSIPSSIGRFHHLNELSLSQDVGENYSVNYSDERAFSLPECMLSMSRVNQIYFSDFSCLNCGGFINNISVKKLSLSEFKAEEFNVKSDSIQTIVLESVYSNDFSVVSSSLDTLTVMGIGDLDSLSFMNPVNHLANYDCSSLRFLSVTGLDSLNAVYVKENFVTLERIRLYGGSFETDVLPCLEVYRDSDLEIQLELLQEVPLGYEWDSVSVSRNEALIRGVNNFKELNPSCSLSFFDSEGDLIK